MSSVCFFLLTVHYSRTGGDFVLVLVYFGNILLYIICRENCRRLFPTDHLKNLRSLIYLGFDKASNTLYILRKAPQPVGEGVPSQDRSVETFDLEREREDHE